MLFPSASIKVIFPIESKCGTEMKIVGFIEREETGLIRMLLSSAGLWKEPAPRAPPPPEPVGVPLFVEPVVDYELSLRS
jgi:hypothetical protein